MNPLKTLRTDRGWTQAELAEFAQVTRLVVIRAEQGLYIQPPTALVRALDFDPITMERLYRNWVKLTRRNNFRLFSQALKYTTVVAFPRFDNFRKLVSPSRAGFCKALVYPISLVEKFEADGTCRESLQVALDEVGLGIQVSNFV